MNKPRKAAEPLSGFIKPRHQYEVRIGHNGNYRSYHIGFAQRAAMQAFARAQKGGKGGAAPCAGMLLTFLQDGRITRGVFPDGEKFRL